MNADPPLLPALICQKCGATNPAHATSCWLCKGAGTNPYAAAPSIQPTSTASRSIVQTPPAQSRAEDVFLVLLLLVLVLAILIAVGLAIQDRGMLVPYLVVVAPALVATGGRALYSVAKGERPKPSALILVFLWSTMATIGLAVLLAVASVIALFLMCISLLNGVR